LHYSALNKQVLNWQNRFHRDNPCGICSAHKTKPVTKQTKIKHKPLANKQLSQNYTKSILQEEQRQRIIKNKLDYSSQLVIKPSNSQYDQCIDKLQLRKQYFDANVHAINKLTTSNT